MFYRIKFDGIIGEILNECGYTTNAQKFNIWPAGLSTSLIKQGKQLGIAAEAAACLGFSKYISDIQEFDSNQKLYHLNAALRVAMKENIDIGVTDQLQAIVENIKNK